MDYPLFDSTNVLYTWELLVNGPVNFIPTIPEPLIAAVSLDFY